MPGQDFFAYCTSLQPLERRQLGLLSSVRHFAGTEPIYRAGEKSDTLYIINRGMVEVLTDEAGSARGATYLSRGDIFGDLELLTELPRQHEVRACEGVSLQVFQRRDFPELERRLPSFFRYLSQQLAGRLLQARDLALARSHCRELSGSLSNFDLVTIFQTIANSSQTGALSIRDEAGRLAAAFAFEKGQPLGGTFEHLRGREAFVQLFLATGQRGSFSFTTEDELAQRPAVGEELGLPLNQLLIEALRARDEFEELRPTLVAPEAPLRRAVPDLALTDELGPLRPVAKRIWAQTAKARPNLRALYHEGAVCELKIFRAVQWLLRTGHLQTEAATPEPVSAR